MSVSQHRRTLDSPEGIVDNTAVADVARVHPETTSDQLTDLIASLSDAEREGSVAQSFSLAERDEYATAPTAARIQALFNGWTRKEAFAKALGLGPSYPLDDFDVSLALDRPAMPHRMASVAEASATGACRRSRPRPVMLRQFAVETHARGVDVRFD